MPFDAADLFERFFAGAGGRAGKRGGRGTARRGRDLEATLSLSFMDAVNGCSKTVTVDIATPCDPCAGTGTADKGASKPSTCSVCKGSGQQSMQNGFFAALVTCRACGGEGVTIKNPCKTCSGSGTVRKPRTVQVAVPPGVDTGVTMRLPGQGDAGERGGSPGHLYVNLAVEPDPFFSRDGADIHVTVPISMTQAVLGCTLTVPTIRGEVDLTIPSGSQPSDKLLMRGRGVRRLDGGTSGNQYVHLRVEIPKKLTSKQKELIQEFATTDGTSNASDQKSKGFLAETIERIKRAINQTDDTSKNN